jgi:hypothetical protein
MKRPPDSDFKRKRIESQRLTIRDQQNNCRVSGVFEINNEHKMIVMTSSNNVYLINKERKITKINIKKWKSLYKCEIDNREFASVWDKSVYKQLNNIKKGEKKRAPVKKIKRNPINKIKRKPVKKIKRRPVK